MKVLIFEHCLQVKGHRIPYASLAALSYVGDNDVVVGLPSVVQDNEIVKRYIKPSITVDYYETTVKQKPLSTALEARRCLNRLIKRYQPDLIAIPTVDGLGLVLGLYNLLGLASNLRSTKVVACLMNGGVAPSNYGFLSRTATNIKWWVTRKGPWHRLMLIDPKAWSELPPSQQQSISLCPDPVPERVPVSKTKARQMLGIPSDGRLMVSLGRQDLRKGVDFLLAAFQAAELNKTDRLLLMGKLTPEINSLLQEVLLSEKMRDRIITADRYVSDEEFGLAIDASDIVTIPYRSANQPSGIVCRALGWNRPILATYQGWLKWTIDEFGAGFGTNPENTSQFARDIETSLSSCLQFTVNEKGKQFAEFNSKANYLRTWQEEAELLTAQPKRIRPPTFLNSSSDAD